jgi:hypothetical protein
MAKMGMEAYIDVALFITPTKTASFSQLFLTKHTDNKKNKVNANYWSMVKQRGRLVKGGERYGKLKALGDD